MIKLQTFQWATAPTVLFAHQSPQPANRRCSPRRAIYQFRPTYSFYCNPTRDRATRSGGAGARDGDYPGLVSSRNRADRSSSWRLGTGAALGKRNGSVFNEER